VSLQNSFLSIFLWKDFILLFFSSLIQNSSKLKICLKKDPKIPPATAANRVVGPQLYLYYMKSLKIRGDHHSFSIHIMINNDLFLGIHLQSYVLPLKQGHIKIQNWKNDKISTEKGYMKKKKKP